VPAACLASVLTWTLFAFGGAYVWTLVPAAVAILVAIVAVRPRIADPNQRTLDFALIGCVVVGLFQLVPLPAGWRAVLTPNAGAIDAALRIGAVTPRIRSLSIDAAATLKGVSVAALTIATFWAARETLARGALRHLVRPIAWSGLVVSVLAIVLRTRSSSLVYGIWSAGDGAVPYGPFVNRNHMGTWLIMALPLVAGYVVARVHRRAGSRSIVSSFDTPMVWLLGSAGAMLAAAIVSLSRSTAVGLCTAAVFAAALALRRTPKAAGWVAGAAVAGLAIVLSLPESVDLAARFQQPEFASTWARPQIWRETLPIVRDFVVTGTGLGSFRTAMLVYQKSDRTFFFNQAHNQYLQFAAEGGVLLLIPLVLAALAFAAIVTRHLRTDASAMFWIRAGAAAGVIAALVQSLWETGLRLPANALLFAVICAIAVHHPRR
jgi:O-antigen ligase